MRTIRLILITAALFACAGAVACYAHDLVQPPWRGSPGTTHQQWQFGTDANPAVPDVVANPYAEPVAQITVGTYGSGWRFSYLSLGVQTGIWDLGQSGTLAIDLADAPQLGVETRKDVWVQVTYYDDITCAPVVGVQNASMSGQSTLLVESVRYGGYWRLDSSKWTLQSADETDRITITSDPHWMALVDQVVVDTRYVALTASVGQAKSFADGTVCELSGPVVTRSFGSFFYLEDRNRASGIRVNCADGQAPGAQDTAPRVCGIVRTIDGERVIDEASVEPGGAGSITPFGMSNRAVSSGLSPQGLLVRLWGHARVTSPEASTFLLDDGSPQSVRIELHGALPPADGAYVAVTGVVGADLAGPVLRAGPGDTLVKSE